MIQRSNVFGAIHPAVQLAYFAIVLVFCMAAMHPVYLSLTFLAAAALSFYLRGWRASLRTLRWQAVLVILIVVINPLVSSAGSTELFRIGERAIYLEGFIYGFFMAIMLVSVMLWFINASTVLTSDKVMAALGGRMPILSLMVSMIMRLIPQFASRGAEIEAAAQATTAACAKTPKERTSEKLRLTSVLMGWSMEDSLETSDAMRARGWSAGRRTSYQRIRFRSQDALMAAALVLLAAANGVLAWIACSQYHFYPSLSVLVPWWGYIPYAVFVFLPIIICFADDLRWGRIEKKAEQWKQ